MKKNNFFAAGMLALGLLIAGCFSSPSAVVSENQAPVDMAGTRWYFSDPDGATSMYIFDSSTYRVMYTGFFMFQDMGAQSLSRDYDRTGAYSVSGRTVTLNPKGGIYLKVKQGGDVIGARIIVEQAKSFTITVGDDSFNLGAITYKKQN